MPEILWFCRWFSRECRRAGKATQKQVISGLNPKIWQKLSHIANWVVEKNMNMNSAQNQLRDSNINGMPQRAIGMCKQLDTIEK